LLGDCVSGASRCGKAMSTGGRMPPSHLDANSRALQRRAHMLAVRLRVDTHSQDAWSARCLRKAAVARDGTYSVGTAAMVARTSSANVVGPVCV
jgi:hypothetical protein